VTREKEWKLQCIAAVTAATMEQRLLLLLLLLLTLCEVQTASMMVAAP
jgi:hypothetical protein